MKFESNRAVEQKMTLEALSEKLKPELKEAAVNLNEWGFDVGEDCRINPESFQKMVPAESIKKDLEQVKQLEKKFEKASTEGDVLEAIKTIGFNTHWLGRRFVALRTSKYDDIINGVDNLIIDTETFEPIAAVDTTTNFRDKAKALKSKIEKGSTVKYGYEIHEEGVAKKSYSQLPLFIVSFPKDQLDGIVENFEGAEERLLEELSLQSRLFPEQFKDTDPAVKAAYQRIAKILGELTEK